MEGIINEILTSIIFIFIAWLLGSMGSFLRAKTHNENYAKYMNIAQMVVNSVEQQCGTASGKAKKGMVKEFLTQQLEKLLSKEEIDHLIESAVFEMKKVLKGGG